jgi:DNA-binding protein HU-beta
VNKSQLIDALAARYEGNRKQAQHALESVLDTITREVARGEKVAITGFGSFEKAVRNARWVTNPQTGERMKSKKKSVPKFTPGQDLKNIISGAKKLPRLTAANMPKPPGMRSAASNASGAASSTAKKASGGASTAKKSAAKKSSGGASTAKKSAAKKSSAAKSTAKKAPAKKSSAAKSTAKKAPAKKSSAAKSTAKKAPATKSTAKKSTAKKAPAKKAPAKKSTAKKSTAKKS